MNERVALLECAELCRTLQRQLENDCYVPSGCLSDRMATAYEKAREGHLAVMKGISTQMQVLRDMIP